MTSRSVWLTPQREEPEVYPYRRVWRTASIEAIVLLAITAAVYLAQRFLPFQLQSSGYRSFAIAYSLLPLALWWLVSYRAERRSLRPRQGLFTVLILGGLMANAIAVPLEKNVFAVGEWLTNADGLTRIIGFTLAVGIMQEFLKYAAVRYSVWPREFRIRNDGIAYAMTAAIGFATALNLNFALSEEVYPAAAALRIAEITLAQVAISTILGYCLAELKLVNVQLWLLPGGLLLAGLLNGLSDVIRAGLVVGGIGVNSSANTAFQGLGMPVFLLIALFVSFSFLINNADERESTRRRPE